MFVSPVKKIVLFVAWTVASLTFPARLAAQLTRENPPPQASDKQDAQNPPAPTPAGKKRLSQEIQITGEETWLDCGIDVQAGEHVLITASGKLRYADAKEENGPEGLGRGFKDLLRVLPLNEAGRGALIGRIGDMDTAQTFFIGARRDVLAPVSGRLSVGINQAASDTGDGTYAVRIEIYAPEGGFTRAAVKQVSSLPGIDTKLFSKIPRRIGDKDGNPGDMVNFLILGSEAAMQRVFTTAGWVKVDADVKDTVLHGILGSLSKEAYLTMPMSQLYLFGRPQDYGWAHAEPFSVVASRNHLRIWKAPFQVNGETLWVGAATHDIGFERDKRNNGVTHKIDPDIDLERDYVEKTLSSTGFVADVSHFLPENPLKEAKTATGGTFHSNGQVLVLKLADSGKDLSAAFAETFCSVLLNEKPDGGEWGPCSDYINLDSSSMKAHSLSAIPASYRVLVIPGVLSSCQANTQAFSEGQAHLKEKHGMAVEFLQMPNATSTDNGRQIAEYLRKQIANDSRKYVIVAYSKGAPDVQEALANDPQAQSAVAAFVTIAGAVGGSPIAETMPSIVERYTATLKLGSCEGDIAQAFKSLRQDVRKQFNADHPEPLVPSFSLAAVSDPNSTSKMLLQAWKLLTAYDPRTDSQLLQVDAQIPGGNFLGALRADHLAVALNYESSSDNTIRTAADHNHYPRVALFEAAVRFAIANINTTPSDSK
jgi:LssY-like putative type I secretion system component LssY